MAQDVYQLNIVGNVAGEYVENVLHFQSSVSGSATPQADALGLCTQFNINCGAAGYIGALPTDYTMDGVKAKRVNNGGGPSAVLLTPGNVGGEGSPSLVSGAGALITEAYYDSGAAKPRWRTTRLFLPGLPTDAAIDGILQAPYIALLLTLILELDQVFVSGGKNYVYCAWSRKEGVAYTTLAGDISPLIGTQRRRYQPSL